MNIVNKKIEIAVYKNENLKKRYTIKNNLTDAFLKNIMFRQLPTTVANDLYPSLVTYNGNPFQRGYMDFTDPKLSITKQTEVVDIIYNDTFTNPDATITYSNKGKTIRTVYQLVSNFGTSPNTTDKLQYLFFGIAPSFGASTMFLTSFVDVSGLNIVFGEETKIFLERTDEIESNETGLLDLNFSNDYLPIRQTSTFIPPTMSNTARIDKIALHYSQNGNGVFDLYDYTDLTWELRDNFTVDITGFADFFEGDGLFPEDDLFPGDDVFPEQPGKIESVRFIYNTGVETFVNIKDLDVSYNDRTIKIKMQVKYLDGRTFGILERYSGEGFSGDTIWL